MPDWSYHLLFKPILNHLPTYYSREFIHRGMSRIATLPGGKYFINFLGREESADELLKTIDTITVKNSIGLSGQIDPLLSGTEAFSNLGFGFLEIGPVTLEENVTPILPSRDQETKQIVFSNEKESIGLKKTIEHLTKLRIKQPIYARITGNTQESVQIIHALNPYVDGFILESFDEGDSEILKITHKPLYLVLDTEKIPILAEEFSFSGIVLEEREGSALNKNMNLVSRVREIRERGFFKTIITVGGVHEPEDAIQLVQSGADLIMLAEGYISSGPGLPKRIKELQIYLSEKETPVISGWKWYFLFGLAMFIGGVIALIISMSYVILPYDERFLGIDREIILAFNERILYFMAHDRMTLAGTIISGGIIYMFLSYFGVRKALRWAKQAVDAAAIIGFLGIFLFIGYGYFDWLHLIFWLVLLPLYILGYKSTRKIRGTPASTNRHNDYVWKHSLIAQFSLVVLGFSFLIGGFVISTIGVSNVFVSTDIVYLCMPPEILNDFNTRLIPVIAHDRAGFGGALISVGLLVLLLALWGFQQGNRWVWWAFLLGGIPAFCAGIFVHFVIGYTTFSHLLPAYYALGLYVIGVFFSYQFFHKK